MIINQMLFENDFKINPEYFGLPLFFLITEKKDMLKMINSVCHSEEDLMFFHDYIKTEDLPESKTLEEIEEDETFDGIEYKVDTTTKMMIDVVYNAHSNYEAKLEDSYEAFYVNDAEFTFEFTEPLIFFIHFDSWFDRFGDTLVRSVSHCKLRDLFSWGIALPEPTYFQNS